MSMRLSCTPSVADRPDAIHDRVELREPLEIGVQAVGEQRVEHVAEDLAEGRAQRRHRRHGGLRLVARADDQQALARPDESPR